MKQLTLSNGVLLPCMGFGCYNTFGDTITSSVRMALEAGYRFIDSAEAYKNEEDVGKALGSAPVPREDLFVLSKAWPSSYGNMEEACRRSLKNLQVDYLDAYLIHWPGTREDVRLHAFEQLLRLNGKGLIRSFGVSNFSIPQLEKIQAEFGICPVIHEIECHPSFQQPEMNAFCREKNIQVISYEPFYRTADFSLPAVQELSEEYGRSPAQIIMRWHLQLDQVPIPKSTHEERIRENISAFGFELSEEDMAKIKTMDTGIRGGQNPEQFPPGF